MHPEDQGRGLLCHRPPDGVQRFVLRERPSGICNRRQQRRSALPAGHGSYWPSAFCRYVWEYKVALAKDAVETMGFQEIQFDYVRFPDGTYDYEKAGTIDYRNENNETKAQAISGF